MKYFILILLLLGLACSKPKRESAEPSGTAVQPAQNDDAVLIADQSGEDSLKGSLRAKAEGSVNKLRVSVRYHSPAARGRILWGGLVPFDRVWVAGAHMATAVEVDNAISVAGTHLPAGKYAFFAIPGNERWTLILNSNWQQHLTDEYDEKLDVVRTVVEPVVRETHQERLQYTVDQDAEGKGKLVLRWGKLEVALPIVVLP